MTKLEKIKLILEGATDYRVKHLPKEKELAYRKLFLKRVKKGMDTYTAVRDSLLELVTKEII